MPKRSRLPLAGAVVLLLLGSGPPASRALYASHDTMVSADPADATPHVVDGKVDAILPMGNRIYVGGSFTQVRNASESRVIPRRGLFALDPATNKVDETFVADFDVNPDRTQGDRGVKALAAAPGNNALFVGGEFGTLNGAAARKLVRVNAVNGSLDPSFDVSVSSAVKDLVVNGSRLFLAGDFTSVAGQSRGGLAAVDAASGALDGDVDIAFTVPRQGNEPRVETIAVTPDGTTLVAGGNFTVAGGQSRWQVALVDVGARPAKVLDWQTDRFDDRDSGPVPLRRRVRQPSPRRRHLSRRHLLRDGHHRRLHQSGVVVRHRQPVGDLSPGQRPPADLGGLQRRRQLYRRGRHRRGHLRRWPFPLVEQPEVRRQQPDGESRPGKRNPGRDRGPRPGQRPPPPVEPGAGTRRRRVGHRLDPRRPVGRERHRQDRRLDGRRLRRLRVPPEARLLPAGRRGAGGAAAAPELARPNCSASAPPGSSSAPSTVRRSARRSSSAPAATEAGSGAPSGSAASSTRAATTAGCCGGATTAPRSALRRPRSTCGGCPPPTRPTTPSCSASRWPASPACSTTAAGSTTPWPATAGCTTATSSASRTSPTTSSAPRCSWPAATATGSTGAGCRG